jgi:hypothetical protein
MRRICRSSAVRAEVCSSLLSDQSCAPTSTISIGRKYYDLWPIGCAETERKFTNDKFSEAKRRLSVAAAACLAGKPEAAVAAGAPLRLEPIDRALDAAEIREMLSQASMTEIP